MSRAELPYGCGIREVEQSREGSCLSSVGVRLAWNALPVWGSLAAIYTHWTWCWEIWNAPVESPLSVFISLGALCCWLAIFFFDQGVSPQAHWERAREWMYGGMCVLILFMFSYRHVPQMISSALALTACSLFMLAALSPRQRVQSFGLWPLMLFSMPITTSYFLAYPLRAATGKLTALMMGMSVRAVGTGLTNGTETVFIDAPCSGLRMLTAGIMLAAFCALLLGLNWKRTVALLAAGAALTLIGNAMRAGTLFIVGDGGGGGGGGQDNPFEMITGLTVFIMGSALLICIADTLQKRQPPWNLKMNAPDTTVRPDTDDPMPSLFICFCLLAVVWTLIVGFDSVVASPASQETYPAPATWNGAPLEKAEVFANLEQWDQTFPGAMRQYRAPAVGQALLLRFTRHATRALHPAELCYQVQGWKITPQPAILDAAGRTWSSFSVQREDRSIVYVYQIYCVLPEGFDYASDDLRDWLASAERVWPDAASWYWNRANPAAPKTLTLTVTLQSESQLTQLP